MESRLKKVKRYCCLLSNYSTLYVVLGNKRACCAALLVLGLRAYVRTDEANCSRGAWCVDRGAKRINRRNESIRLDSYDSEASVDGDERRRLRRGRTHARASFVGGGGARSAQARAEAQRRGTRSLRRARVAHLVDDLQRSPQELAHLRAGAASVGHVLGLAHHDGHEVVLVELLDQLVLQRVLAMVNEKVHDGLGDHVDEVLPHDGEVGREEGFDDLRLHPLAIRGDVGLEHGVGDARESHNGGREGALSR